MYKLTSLKIDHICFHYEKTDFDPITHKSTGKFLVSLPLEITVSGLDRHTLKKIRAYIREQIKLQSK